MIKSIFYDRSKGRYCERWSEDGKERCHYLPEEISFSEVQRLRRVFSRGILWEDWITLDLKNYESQVREPTLLKLEGLYRRMTEMFEPELLLDINFELILEYRNLRIADRIRPSTFNTELAMLRAALYRAVGLGYINDNPAASKGSRGHTMSSQRVPLKLKVDEKPVRVISKNEFQKLLDVCPTDDWRMILNLGYYAGLRISEILALRSCDVDLERRIIYIYSYKDHRWRTKTGNGRQVWIFDNLYEVLCCCGLADGFVVGDISAKGKMCQRASDQACARFRIICQRAGLVDHRGIHLYTLHDLRKSCISRWKRAGLDIHWVQEMAGHKNIMTTFKHYIEPRPFEEIARQVQGSNQQGTDWRSL